MPMAEMSDARLEQRGVPCRWPVGPRLAGGRPSLEGTDKFVDAFARGLVAEEVELVFNVPDEMTIHLDQSLADHGVRVVRPRHEQNAVLMADGYSRVAKEPGSVAMPGRSEPDSPYRRTAINEEMQ
jgi:Thiamine pyrophosphate enzyme, N-terminal TPP binding domain